jgi:hypothetical protein
VFCNNLTYKRNLFKNGKKVYSGSIEIKVFFMKKFLFITAITIILLGLLISCEEDGIAPPETLIVFNNTQGISDVTVFEDPRRRNNDIIARVPAGQLSKEIKWAANASTSFYFTYNVGVTGITGFTFDYVPPFGRDQIETSIISGVTNNITIPKLEDTVLSSDMLLSNDSFIVLTNSSSFSFRLQRGSIAIIPDNLPDAPVVMAGEMAHYRINPGAVSAYHLFTRGLEIQFPDSLINFEAGYVYVFDYTINGISFVRITRLVLGNL